MTMLTCDTELVVERCFCGIEYAIPKSLHDTQLRQFNNGYQQTDIYCPVGHAWHRVGTPKYVKLERELQRERQQHDQTRADAAFQKQQKEHARLQARAQRGIVTKMRKRVADGKCPCCKASFADLGKHMAENHPHYRELVK